MRLVAAQDLGSQQGLALRLGQYGAPFIGALPRQADQDGQALHRSSDVMAAWQERRRHGST
jgi:hypothetical protein